MRSIRTTTLLALLGSALSAPLPTVAQTVGGQSLTGNWVRADSNNDPNDTMRIRVDPGGAVLTFVPSTASSSWKVGQVLWQGIQPNGSLQIRGSDGNYYPSTLAFEGPDVVHIDIQHTGAGNDQTWRRAGPTIDGDWEQIAPAGGPSGTQVRAQGGGASIRYMPASAPRGYRIGRQLWQNIGAGGAMQVLGSDGRYHPAQVTLIGSDSLRIDSSSPRVGSGQIWVRPGIVAAARAGLSAPPANPNQPGSGLQPPGGLPTAPTPPATPPVPPAAPPACLATSMPHDRQGLVWGLGMYSPSNDDPRAETLGIRDYTVSGLTTPWSGDVPSDIEHVKLPGLQDGVAWIWDRGTSRRVFRDQTAGQLDQRIQSARSAGERPIDIEGRSSASGMAYSTVWGSNVEGIDWRVSYDLTGTQYGAEFQDNRDEGYRLVDVEAYQTPNGLRYAAIWHQSCDQGNWRQLRDMSRTAYDTELDAMTAQGFRVIDFESYASPGGQRYAAIWERIPVGRAWAVRSDRDLNWFLNYHRRYIDEGLRLIDFESYDTVNGVRFAGVWAENDARHDYPFKAAVDAAIAAHRRTRGIPGISVVVMQDDEVIYRRGFGWADSVQQKQAHAGTVYITASIAKAIGGTIAARLEERGIIDLSAPTRSILTNMPSGHTHTVEQLFAKTGCVPHYSEIGNGARPDPTVVYTWQLDAAEEIWKDGLLANCVPGDHYHYSTHGYTIAGAALEEATGKPIGDILRDELTSPFNLPSMRLMVSGRWGGFGALGVRPYHLARAYDRHPTKPAWRVEINYENATWKALGGGIQTNALDLARFGWLTLDGRIVSPAARDQRLWRTLTNAALDWEDGSRAPSVGLAWVLAGRGPRVVTSSGSRDRVVAEHGGSAPGARSLLRIYRSEGLTIAILSNLRYDLSVAGTLNLKQADPEDLDVGHPVGNLATEIARQVFQNPPP